MKKLFLTIALVLLSTQANADSLSLHNANQKTNLRADDHAPIGVMGDHMHKKGEWMVSYRYMRMEMSGNRDGTNDLSPAEIATTVPNRFFGTPGQPPTLRVVPTEMSTDMHMIGGMYAPNDTVTLMAMGSYIDREMEHTTFQGGAGTTELGEFTTRSKGFGDVKLGGLVKLYEDKTHNLHLNAGLSLPTGSISKRDTVLAPNGTTPDLRMPYAMQLGSGTYDALPGVTYNGKAGDFGWGAQYNATLRMGRNDEGYSLGNKHQVSGWGSYAIMPAMSVSARVTAETESDIDGIDDQIVAPVQTADPDNFGGERVSASLGLNTVVPNGVLKGHRFAVEGTVPVYQDLNGPQLKRDFAITAGWQKSF